jgi:hypothetical protein
MHGSPRPFRLLRKWLAFQVLNNTDVGWEREMELKKPAEVFR